MVIAREPKGRQGAFISYSRKDGEAFARALCEKLSSRSISVWHDRACMEGGRDWWEQIKDALDHVEYMVLIMTPVATQSEMVRKEWRYARQRGVCVYPVIGDPDIDIASLPRWMRSVHWYDLAFEEEKFLQDLNTRCQLRRVPFMAEPLPPDFVSRNGEFEQLKNMLLSPNKDEPVAITAALRGAGGYGKTTLARAICGDDDIQHAFDDGILWVTLGESPSTATLLGKVNDLIETLSEERPNFDGLEAASTRLRELLADRDILLVVDDVWRAVDLRPFLFGGTRCARLITTRRTNALPVNAAKVPVDQMSGAEAADLLSRGLPTGNERAVHALAARLGEWPLLLKLGNSWLRKRIHGSLQPIDQALSSFDAALTRRGVTAFDSQNAEERTDAAAKTLELSFAGLAPADQSRLLELAVFEEDLNIPMTLLERFWSYTGGLDELGVEEACQRLFDESLLVAFNLHERFVRLHDAIRGWLVGRPCTVSLGHRHELLLKSYELHAQPWREVPDDGYVHAHLARHLAAAGRQSDLHGLLLDLDWIQIRLLARSGAHRATATTDVYGLLTAYDELASSPDMILMRRALQMSTHVLAKHPSEVAMQVYGRLGTSDLPPVRALCERAVSRATSRALLPMRPALKAPGMLILTLTGHTNRVVGAMLLAKGRQALSWSFDCTLKLWDLKRGEVIHDLAGHEDLVQGAAVLAEDRQVLSWSNDGTLRLWDLESGELLHIFAGHGGPVYGVALLAQGRKALSWSQDHTLKLWDLERGELLHDLAGHADRVDGAVLLAEGRKALSWSHDRTLKLWDLEHGEPLHDLAGHGDGIAGAAVFAEGRRALSWSADATLKLWDLERGELLHTLGGHQLWVYGAALLDKGLQALSWSFDCTLKLWDLEHGRLRHDLAGHELRIEDVTLLANGRQAMSWSEDGTLKLWDLERGKVLHTLVGHQGPIYGAAMTAEDRALSWSEDGTLKLWDLERGELIHNLAAHEGGVEGATLLANGKQALSWSHDRTLKLWDLERGDQLQDLSRHHRLEVNGTALRAEGRQALSWASDDVLKLWDLECGQLVHDLVGHEDAVRGATLLAEGRQVLSWSKDGTLKLWDLERGELLRNLVGHESWVTGAILLANGRQVLSWSFDNTLKLWDLERGELIHDLGRLEKFVSAVTLMADGRQALSRSYDDSLKLWDLERGELLRDFAGHENQAYGHMLLSEGRRALSCLSNNKLKLWDLGSVELLQDFTGHKGRVGGATLLAAGRQALSWSDDRTLKLWDLAGGRLLQDLKGHEGSVSGAAVSGSGGQALSWSSDGTLKLWDLQGGKLLQNFTGHERPVTGALLLAEGSQALSWSDDRSVRVWDLAGGRCVDVYVTDFAPVALIVGLQGRRAFHGDSSGRLHLLRLKVA